MFVSGRLRPIPEDGREEILRFSTSLRDLIGKKLSGSDKPKKIEIVHNYGKAERDEVDFSNPFSLLASMAKSREQLSGKPQIALIYLTGVITDGDGRQGMFGGESAGSEELRKALRVAAREDPFPGLA